MNAARDTITAISQGLYLGFQMSWSSVSAAELIGGIRSAPRSWRGEVGGPGFLPARTQFSPGFSGQQVDGAAPRPCTPLPFPPPRVFCQSHGATPAGRQAL